MNKRDLTWAIAKSAFANDIARIEDQINDFAARLQGAAASRVNFAARDYAPDLLHVIRRNKIERAIARRQTWKVEVHGAEMSLGNMSGFIAPNSGSN